MGITCHSLPLLMALSCTKVGRSRQTWRHAQGGKVRHVWYRSSECLSTIQHSDTRCLMRDCPDTTGNACQLQRGMAVPYKGWTAR